MLSATSQLYYPEPVLTSFQRLGFASLAAFLFILHSRVFDMRLWWLHIPSVILGSALVIALFSGGVVRAFANRTGVCLLVLSAWMCLATAFSVWRGGSAAILKDQWINCILIYFVIAALIASWEQYRATYAVLCVSVLVLALMTLAFGTPNEDGRLALGRGRFGNPNDLAQILLMSLPLWWYMATRPDTRLVKRVSAQLASLVIFVTIAKTGSRGALIATAGLLVVLFLRTSLKHKVQLATAGMLVSAFAAATLPASLKQRYFTFFNSPESSGMGIVASEIEDNATSSAMARWMLLQDSITLTLQNPVFGVGPGVFDVAQDLYSREVRGVKGGWQHTHNTYTQISSENGIPALILYILIIVFIWRAARASKPRGRQMTRRESDVRAAAYALRLSLFVFCISAFFGSFGYQTQLVVLAGLSIALRQVTGGSALAAVAAAGAAPRAREFIRSAARALVWQRSRAQ